MAVENINRFRQAIQIKIAEYNGTIIQYYGDGCLMLFNSSVNAVLFAKSLQKDFNVSPCLPVRIGIHMGDVLVKEGNIFGDVVNIAARIQALAPQGRIYVSETVYENTKNKKEAGSRFVQQVILKNVQTPVGIYEVIMDGDEKAFSLNHFEKYNYSPAVSTNSIAVLPFLNISGDPEQEYFSEGMNDEIINSLTQLED